MDFRPSPAQQILTTTARAFLRQHCPPQLVQRLALDERGFDEALWRRMAELGWPGLLIPSDLGGSDGAQSVALQKDGKIVTEQFFYNAPDA